MHQDKILARILLIFSVANIALAAPTVVRQRHLDVAKAASQKRGSNSDNEETGDIQPESSSAAANRITTQVSAPPVSGNGATGDIPPESSSHMSPHDGLTNGWAESSSAANRITTQASGPLVSGNGATGDLPLESSSHMPPHDGLTNGWAESSSAAANRLTPLAPGSPMGNEAMGNLRPQSSSGWSYWLDHVSLPEPGSPAWGNAATGDLPPRPPHNSPSDEWALGTHVSSPGWSSSDGSTTQAPGATSSSSSDSGHLGDLPPPAHQGPAPESLAAPEANGLFRDALTRKILLYSGVAGVIGGTAALAYGIHKWVKHPYVSPLSPADI
jgi:hypothetical protein